MATDLPEYDVDLEADGPLDAGTDEGHVQDPAPEVEDPYPSTGEVIEPTPETYFPEPRPIGVRV